MRTNKLRNALLHHHDAVGKLDRGQSVRHENRRSTADKLFKRLMNEAFALQVNLTCRFVEQEDLRILEQRSSERDTLALSARKRAAARSNDRFITVCKLVADEFIGVSVLRSLNYFFASRVKTTVANIFQTVSLKRTESCETSPI